MNIWLEFAKVYAVGLGIGTLVAIIKFGNVKNLTWFEAWTPAVIWPLAVIKEAIKYLRK